MFQTFEYDPQFLRDAYRLWKARGRVPTSKEIERLVAMPSDERHTFVNDLVDFESVVRYMKTMTPLIDDRIKLLVAKRQYDTARKLASQYPDDPVAQQYLRDIDILETPVERGAKSVMKFAAIIAVLILIIMIGIVIFTVISLR
jgi:hypothetical protein